LRQIMPTCLTATNSNASSSSTGSYNPMTISDNLVSFVTNYVIKSADGTTYDNGRSKDSAWTLLKNDLAPCVTTVNNHLSGKIYSLININLMH